MKTKKTKKPVPPKLLRHLGPLVIFFDESEYEEKKKRQVPIEHLIFGLETRIIGNA